MRQQGEQPQAHESETRLEGERHCLRHQEPGAQPLTERRSRGEDEDGEQRETQPDRPEGEGSDEGTGGTGTAEGMPPGRAWIRPARLVGHTSPSSASFAAVSALLGSTW